MQNEAGNYDPAFVAYHRDAADLLLPYDLRYEGAISVDYDWSVHGLQLPAGMSLTTQSRFEASYRAYFYCYHVTYVLQLSPSFQVLYPRHVLRFSRFVTENPDHKWSTFDLFSLLLLFNLLLLLLLFIIFFLSFAYPRKCYGLELHSNVVMIQNMIESLAPAEWKVWFCWLWMFTCYIETLRPVCVYVGGLFVKMLMPLEPMACCGCELPTAWGGKILITLCPFRIQTLLQTARFNVFVQRLRAWLFCTCISQGYLSFLATGSSFCVYS